MICYGDLVKYTKDNHINWNKDLFDVLRDFFNQYSQTPHTPPSISSIQQELVFSKEKAKEPEDGEYTIQDLFNLFEL